MCQALGLIAVILFSWLSQEVTFLLSPSDGWGNWGSERLRNLPKIIPLMHNKALWNSKVWLLILMLPCKVYLPNSPPLKMLICADPEYSSPIPIRSREGCENEWSLRTWGFHIGLSLRDLGKNLVHNTPASSANSSCMTLNETLNHGASMSSWPLALPVSLFLCLSSSPAGRRAEPWTLQTGQAAALTYPHFPIPTSMPQSPQDSGTTIAWTIIQNEGNEYLWWRSSFFFFF